MNHALDFMHVGWQAVPCLKYECWSEKQINALLDITDHSRYNSRDVWISTGQDETKEMLNGCLHNDSDQIQTTLLDLYELHCGNTITIPQFDMLHHVVVVCLKESVFYWSWWAHHWCGAACKTVFCPIFHVGLTKCRMKIIQIKYRQFSGQSMCVDLHFQWLYRKIKSP